MLKLAAIFKDGMILQRNSIVRIWGDSDCEYIEILFCGKTYVADSSNGKWKADISTGMSETPLTMYVISRDKNDATEMDRIEVEDILLGDVWLAGGQSNMELELRNSLDGYLVENSSNYSNIRFYNVPKYSNVDEELVRLENNAKWNKAERNSFGDMSAVAYYFATKLYEETHVPIGIIGCYLGGTSATCWVSEEALSDVSEVRNYLNEWKDACDNKTEYQYEEELNAYNGKCDEWVTLVDKLKYENPEISLSEIAEVAGSYPWPMPKGRKSPFRPFALHESMIKRIAPYGIKGFIYYQGEEDSERADYYSKLNNAVINQWRNDFYIEGNKKEIPFIITQLPMYSETGRIDDKSWCVVREQQEKCVRENSNVTMAVIIDCGEFDNVHPLDKRTPGERLAFSALNNVYGIKKYAENMYVSNVIFVNNTCELNFENVYEAICYKMTDGNNLTAEEKKLIKINNENAEFVYGFEISSDNINYYKPSISVCGDKLILSGRKNENITCVRYGWWNYGVVNVYNSEAMPLAPFSIVDDKIESN